MSSSQQPPPNFNNNGPPNENPQMHSSALLNDYYFEDAGALSNNLPYSNQIWMGYPNFNYYTDHTGQTYYHSDYQYVAPEEHDEKDDAIEKELEADIDEREGLMGDEQFDINNENEGIYSEDVQNAFANYEKEYSKFWKHNEPTSSNFSDHEQDITFDEMEECMRFMNDDNYNSTIPHNLNENIQEVVLNPDAVEFKPSWLLSSTPSTTTTAIDKESTVVASEHFNETKEQ